MRKKSAVQHWLQVVQGLSRRSVKTAELGGHGGDIGFEQAMSNLAHAALRENAPGLLDYEVGFQLVDSNEDHTKAIGIFAFKVGSQWLYGPVFYLNGKLKGNEMVYLKNQDMFVPMSEKWLNYLLNRKPDILGDGVTRNSASLGVSYPDLNAMRHSPQTKFGSAELKKAIDDVLPAMFATASLDVNATFAKLAATLNLPGFLKSASLSTVERFVGLCHEMPELAVYFDNTYGLSHVSEAIKTAAARRPCTSVLTTPRPRTQVKTGTVLGDSRKLHPIKSGALKVVVPDPNDSAAPEGLSPEEQERLFQDKILIKDERDDEEVSVPYNVQVSQRLQNPTETGLYDVLTKPHEFERCLVVIGPLGPDGRKPFATVIRTGDSADWVNTPTTEIWVSEQATREEFKEWWEGLKTADSLSTDGAKYVLIGPTGDATLAFSVSSAFGTAESVGETYRVRFDDYVSRKQTWGMPRLSRYPEWETSEPDGEHVHLNGKRGTKLRAFRGNVYVPEGFKLIKVKPSWHDCCDTGSSKKSPLRPGNLLDVQMSIMNSKLGPVAGDEKQAAAFPLASAVEAQAFYLTKTAALSVIVDGPDVTINGQRMGPIDAVTHLVRDHALREKFARHALKQASVRGKFTCRLAYPEYVKQANGYLTGGGQTAPAIPEPQVGGDSTFGSSIPTQSPMQEFLPVPGMEGSNTDPSTYDPKSPIKGGLQPREMQAIQSSLQSGQKEVIDTTVISNMLKTVRDDSMIDKYMGPLLHGLDALCRILFFFYWHGEEFADRFGKQDLPELEDGLRNTIDSMGDVCIYLRKKSVDPYPGGGDLDLNLDAPASS